MTTTILKHTDLPELQPAYGLFQLFQPENAPYRFQAQSLEQALRWQFEVRPKFLQTLLGTFSPPLSDFSPQIIESVDKGNYIREKWTIKTWKYSILSFYLLVPKHIQPPFTPILAMHGHGYGVKDIVGLSEEGQERDIPEGYQKDFAIELCRQGFMVIAPEISCFGERQTGNAISRLNGMELDSCDHTAHLAAHLGTSAMGIRVFDTLRLVDYMEGKAEIDLEHLGIMGISGGGMNAFFSAAIDTRIKACVISGYFASFRDTILDMFHCPCNFIPGIGNFGEMVDLIGLVAPRPVLVESGSHDKSFPQAVVKHNARIAKENVYATFHAAEQFEADYFEGDHQISGRRAYSFLQEKLTLNHNQNSGGFKNETSQ